MQKRPSLPKLEHFSKNPRKIRDQNPVPFLSLLGINTSKNNFSPSANSARVKPKITLPPLSEIPGFLPENNTSIPSDGGSRGGSSRTQRTFDESLVKPLPGAPLTPAEVLQLFSHQLVPLELGEILDYKQIYYIGDLEYKPFRASYDSDYDNHKKQYHCIPNDHIKYRYQVISYAGGGSFSNVYRCFDHKLGIPVAVKIIRAKPDCLQYAELEAKIQSQVHGKHSVKLIESFSFRGHYCLSLELLYTDILSIAEKQRYQQLPPSTVRHITFQVLLSLREMTAKGIVHADIKPENILTNDESLLNTKVADFGTACFTEEQMFTYIQSRYYRAPEVLYGIRYGPPIDIWSLGCVVFELISGQVLFSAQDEVELAKMLTISIGPPPPEIYKNSRNWDQLQLLVNNPNEAYNNGNEYDDEDEHVNEFGNDNDYENMSSDDNLLYGFSFNANSTPPNTNFDTNDEYEYVYEEDRVDGSVKTQPLPIMLTYLPRAAAQFVKDCLVWDPQKRMTPDEALQSEWMQEEIEILLAKREKLEKEKEAMQKSTANKKSNMISSITSQKKYAVKEPQTARIKNRPRWHC